MNILSDADHARHDAAIQLRGASRAPEIGLSPEDQEELWVSIESTLVPVLVQRLIQQARITYGAGREATAMCYLRVDASLVPEGFSMLKMAKLQLMLDRIVDFHALRDGDIKADMRNARRLRKLFDDELALFISGYSIAVEPKWFDYNDMQPGKMKALHLDTMVVLAPKPDNPNAGPRIFSDRDRWKKQLEGG